MSDIITYPTIKVRNLIAKKEKEENQEHIMCISYNNKNYYIYIVINNIEYPVCLAKYQRPSHVNGEKASKFIDYTKKSMIMQPALNINLRVIDEVVYAVIIDGQQRITTAVKIKENLIKPKMHDKYKKWSVKEKSDFDNYIMPYELYQDLTYEQEVELFKTINTAATALTKAELRNSTMTDSVESRLGVLKDHCRAYEENRKKGKQFDQVFRNVSIYYQVYNTNIISCLKINNLGDDNGIMSLRNYISDMSEQDFKLLKKDLKRIDNCTNDIIGSILKETGSCFKNLYGSQKLLNVDVAVMAFMKLIKNHSEKLLEFEEYEDDLKETIKEFFDENIPLTVGSLKKIDEMSDELLNKLELSIIEIF